VRNVTHVPEQTINKSANYESSIKNTKANVKTHSDSNNPATIVIDRGRFICFDDLRDNTDFASSPATSNAQSLAAVECFDANDRLEHLKWRAVTAADLFKYASIDTFLSRVDAHKAAAEWTCTAHVYATAGLIVE
jgi:hypothetical protein